MASYDFDKEHFETLVFLDPQSLIRLCSTDPKITNICGSEEFLFEKLKHDGLNPDYAKFIVDLKEYAILYKTKDLEIQNLDYELLNRVVDEIVQTSNYDLLVTFVEEITERVINELNLRINNNIKNIGQEVAERQAQINELERSKRFTNLGEHEEIDRQIDLISLDQDVWNNSLMKVIKDTYVYLMDYIIYFLVNVVLVLSKKGEFNNVVQVGDFAKNVANFYYNEDIIDFVDLIKKEIGEPYKTIIKLQEDNSNSLDLIVYSKALIDAIQTNNKNHLNELLDIDADIRIPAITNDGSFIYPIDILRRIRDDEMLEIVEEYYPL